MSEQNSGRAASLLGRAYAEGELSEKSKDSLLAVGHIAEQVGYALGDTAESDEVLLVTILVDDSSSITEASHGSEAVRLGHNLCLDVLECAAGIEVLVHTRYLNEGSASPYLPVGRAPRLTEANYEPTVPNTPLYRQSVVTFGAVMAKVRAEQELGRKLRAFTLLVTDGGDNASLGITAKHVRFLVSDMLEFSSQHIVAGMGIGSPGQFREIFTQMGVPRDWILTPDATAADIKRVFREEVAPSLKLAASGSVTGWRQLQAGPASVD